MHPPYDKIVPMKSYLALVLLFPLVANAQEEKKPPIPKKEAIRIECPETVNSRLLLTIDTEQNTVQVISKNDMGNQEEYITESLQVTEERYIILYRGPATTNWIYELNIDRTNGSYYLGDTKKKTLTKSAQAEPDYH